MDDKKLLKLLKRNPNDGIDKAIEIYAPLVKTIVIRILGSENKQDIEECISDIFVKLWKSIDRYDADKGSLKNYIISISRFTAIDYYRRIIKNYDLLSIEENEIDANINLDKEVSKNINKEIINKTLNELKEPDREIFIRRYFLYEPVKSIAEKLNLSTKLVENTLYRGKQKLKDILLQNRIIV